MRWLEKRDNEVKKRKYDDNWLYDDPVGIFHRWMMECEDRNGIPETEEAQGKYLDFAEMMTKFETKG